MDKLTVLFDILIIINGVLAVGLWYVFFNFDDWRELSLKQLKFILIVVIGSGMLEGACIVLAYSPH